VDRLIVRERQVVWQAWAGLSLESCRVVPSHDGVRAESVAVGVEEGTPWAVRYVVHCDAGWRTRRLSVESLHGGDGPLTMTGDGAGRWTGARGERLPAFDGCLDVDLTSTVFTNTLPIRRLELAPGRSGDIAVVYLTVPGLEVSVARQRYVCLSRSPDDGRYRLEGLDTGFSAEISVDADGLVIEYPDIARRVWSR
jgi:uncharacterized protein